MITQALGAHVFGAGYSEPWQFRGYTTFRTVWIKNHDVKNDDLAAVIQSMSSGSHDDYLLMTRSGIAGLQLLSGVTPEEVQTFEASAAIIAEVPTSLRESGCASVQTHRPR